MPSFFDTLRSALLRPVGDNQNSDPNDVRKTRRNMAALGYEAGDTDRGYVDGALDSAIRGFQRDKGLRADGLMNPGGETERAVNRELSRVQEVNARPRKAASPLRLSGAVGNNRSNESSDVSQVQRVLSALGFVSEAKGEEPIGIIDRETADGIEAFQSQNDLRKDGYLNPGGETETAINALLAQQQGSDGGGEGEEDGGGDDNDEEDTPPPPPGDEGEDEEEPDCSEAEAALEQAEVELETAEQELQVALSSLEEIKAQIETLEAELQKLEKEPENKKGRCQKLQNDLKNFILQERSDIDAMNKADKEAKRIRPLLEKAREELAKELGEAGVDGGSISSFMGVKWKIIMGGLTLLTNGLEIEAAREKVEMLEEDLNQAIKNQEFFFAQAQQTRKDIKATQQEISELGCNSK